MARIGPSRSSAAAWALTAIALVVAAVLIRGSVGRTAARLAQLPSNVAGPVDPSSVVRVTVRQGMGGAAIGQLLESAGAVSDAARFSILLDASGVASELQAG